jgi:hypothetical protein
LGSEQAADDGEQTHGENRAVLSLHWSQVLI